MKAVIKHPTGTVIFSLISQFLPPLNHSIYVSGSVLQKWMNLVLVSQIYYLLLCGKEELFILNVLYQLKVLFFFSYFSPTNELNFSNIEIYY